MSKTKEELNKIKEEVESLNEKLNELTLEVASEVAHAIFGTEQMDIDATHMPKQP